MNTETKEQTLQKGTVIKLDGFPYELCEDVRVRGNSIHNNGGEVSLSEASPPPTD